MSMGKWRYITLEVVLTSHTDVKNESSDSGGGQMLIKVPRNEPWGPLVYSFLLLLKNK